MKLALTNALMIDGQGAVVERATILIRDGVFVECGANVTIPEDTEQRIDVEGRAVLPGLIDLHAHVIGGNRAQGSNRYAYETVAYQLINPDMPFRDPIVRSHERLGTNPRGASFPACRLALARPHSASWEAWPTNAFTSS